jgi:hypothetical protein
VAARANRRSFTLSFQSGSSGVRVAAKKKSMTKASDSDGVDAYLKNLKHPLADLVKALRKTILAVDAKIGEEIKWNAPAFFYAGELKDSDPKEYRRYLVILNLFKKDALRLVFWRGDRVKDESGFLEGEYPDGRRLAILSSTADLTAKKKLLVASIKQQLKHIHD